MSLKELGGQPLRAVLAVCSAGGHSREFAGQLSHQRPGTDLPTGRHTGASPRQIGPHSSVR